MFGRIAVFCAWRFVVRLCLVANTQYKVGCAPLGHSVINGQMFHLDSSAYCQSSSIIFCFIDLSIPNRQSGSPLVSIARAAFAGAAWATCPSAKRGQFTVTDAPGGNALACYGRGGDDPSLHLYPTKTAPKRCIRCKKNDCRQCDGNVF